jgi:hypothetical protein
LAGVPPLVGGGPGPLPLRWGRTARAAAAAQTYEGYIRRTILPALGSMELRKVRGPVLDMLYARLHRCGDLACSGMPFTEHLVTGSSTAAVLLALCGSTAIITSSLKGVPPGHRDLFRRGRQCNFWQRRPLLSHNLTG